MVKSWPDSVVTKAYELLTLAFNGTPYMGWLCPKPKDPENGITLDGLRSPLEPCRGGTVESKGQKLVGLSDY